MSTANRVILTYADYLADGEARQRLDHHVACLRAEAVQRYIIQPIARLFAR